MFLFPIKLGFDVLDQGGERGEQGVTFQGLESNVGTDSHGTSIKIL